MEAVKRRYLAKFDEINVILSETDIETTSVGEMQEIFRSIMMDAFFEGYAVAGYMLDDVYDRIPAWSFIIEELCREFEGKTTDDRVAEYVIARDRSALKTVADTEFHRMFSTGEMRRARDSRIPCQKEWLTMHDPKVRKNHSYLDGIRLPLDDEFYTFDGDHAEAPGGFMSVENNANCRCILKLTKY